MSGKEERMEVLVTDEELDGIRARVDASTSGKWIEYLQSRDRISGSDLISTDGEDISMPGASVADYVFVAAAHQDVPKLLDDIERLRGGSAGTILTDGELAAIRERIEGATPGPWVLAGLIEPGLSAVSNGGGRPVMHLYAPGPDTAFIVSAREDLPRLLGVLDRLRAEKGV
jgi:hypothetical protein